jgi:2,4-dienoyl-CoA reductase-like NADH-dependent reductase (Old Yellow Enzyme family)
MKQFFNSFSLGGLQLANRFIFPPIKTGYGSPDGKVTERQITYYRQIAANGPAVLILEPAAVTPDGREHPKQLSVHHPHSQSELRKLTDVIHDQERLACLHLNHAGAAANPKASGGQPLAPSPVTCPTTGLTAEVLTHEQIRNIIEGYRQAAATAAAAGFDLIEIQGGHGYLISQFLNARINQRDDDYGRDRLRFAGEALKAVREGAPQLPVILRISGSEMSPEFGVAADDVKALLDLAAGQGVVAVHVGMGSACFSPPWYFHHSALPEKPQLDALAWVRKQTTLPVIAAGRMGRMDKIDQIEESHLADLIALGRPLIADPDFIEKWQQEKYDEVRYCGYCLQGCLHRLKNAQPLGCNLNPELGLPELSPTRKPLKVLIAGGGPAGMSAAKYLSQRGHRVILAEKKDRLGGQFNLAWQAPGKEQMHDGLDTLSYCARANAESLMLGRAVDADLVREVKPDLLVWAAGAVQNIPQIDGLDDQHRMTALEFFEGSGEIRGPRVLVIGAGRAGIEIAEKLGMQKYQVVATKRTDPIGSMMEMITRKLILMRIGKMDNVTLMPHTTVKAFRPGEVVVEQDGEKKTLEPFQTVILASGMRSAPGPDEAIRAAVGTIEVIGDASQVQDIFSAVHAGYEVACNY